MKQGYKKFTLAGMWCLFAITSFATGHVVTITTQFDVSCFGGCNGYAATSVSGGTGPFSYSWAPNGVTTSNASGLCAGSYTVTVTDQSDGSTATATVLITQPTQLTLSPNNIVPATCGNPNGQACVLVSGGNPGYTFMWSPSGAPTSCANNLVAGTYTATATDANGCTVITMVTIPNASGPVINSITASPTVICAGQSSTLNPNITGGTPPYSFNWTNPGNSLNSTATPNPIATPTVTTTYTLTVTDANGCVSNQTVTVVVNQAVAANVSETDPTCNQSNGSLTVNITQGSPPYSILWSNSQTTPTISNLTAGIYSVTVTDVNGCSISQSAGLSNIGGPTVTTSTTSASCTNSNNGSASANVTGIAPFTYQWNSSPVQTTQTATGLDAGNYLVSVTDSAGCVSVVAAQVNALAGNLYMYVTSLAGANCTTATGAAGIYVSGGTQPYSFAWSTGATTQNIVGVTGGTYTVSVSDANGCVENGSVNVPIFCANVVTGRAFFDANNDGIFNGGDSPISGMTINVAPGYYYTTTDTGGHYYRALWSVDTFDVSPAGNLFSYYTCTSPIGGHAQVIFPSMGDTSYVDFVFYNPVPFQDLYLNLASGVARPGFQQVYTVMTQNRGTTTVSDTIWFIHDSILTLSNANPAFDGYTYPTGYWLFNNFTPGATETRTVIVNVPTIQNGGYIGRSMIANARIEPTSSDTTSWDNGDDEQDIIQGSYDPNLKECWSPTMNSSGDIWPGDLTLDYTIHFQNSGTDTAFTVVVVDTLPVELDITTFRIGASSHPCTYSISGYNDTNVVTFTFMNILLPDSNINEPASHGYVQFTIDRYPNLPIGTQIINEANNYFDFNPAVVTNMNVVTISNPLSVVEPGGNEIMLYPNPAQENVNVVLGNNYVGDDAIVVLRDITGREIAKVNSGGNTLVTFNLASYSAGVYFVSVQTASGETTTQKLIISEK